MYIFMPFVENTMKFYIGLSTMKKIFWICIVQYSSYQPHMTTDLWNTVTVTKKLNFKFYLILTTVNLNSNQFSPVTQLWTILCDPMDCSMPGLPVHHHLLEFTQTHVHWASDAIQPSIVDTVLLYVDLSSLEIFCLSNITVSLSSSKCCINFCKQHYIPMWWI